LHVLFKSVSKITPCFSDLSISVFHIIKLRPSPKHAANGRLSPVIQEALTCEGALLLIWNSTAIPGELCHGEHGRASQQNRAEVRHKNPDNRLS